MPDQHAWAVFRGKVLLDIVQGAVGIFFLLGRGVHILTHPIRFHIIIASILDGTGKPQTGCPLNYFRDFQFLIICCLGSEFHATVVVQDYLYFTGNRIILIFSDERHTIEFFVIGSTTDHGQIAACRFSPNSKTLRIVSIFLSIGTQKTDRRFHILHPCRKCRFLSQSIVDGRTCISMITEIAIHQLCLSGLAVIKDKTAAMNHYDHGHWFVTVRHI